MGHGLAYYQKIHYDVFTYQPKQQRPGKLPIRVGAIKQANTITKATPISKSRLVLGPFIPSAPSSPVPLSPTTIADAALPAILATPAPVLKANRLIRQQKHKQKMVVCLYTSVTIAELDQGQRARNILEQRANQVTGGASQSGRGMHVRRPTKHSSQKPHVLPIYRQIMVPFSSELRLVLFANNSLPAAYGVFVVGKYHAYPLKCC